MTTEILPEINLQLCDGCGDCISACGAGALALINGRAELTQPNLCEYDGQCEPACPAGAISLPYAIILSVPS